MSETKPFEGKIQRAIVPETMNFLMLYYLPTGSNAGGQTSTGKTYYIQWINQCQTNAVFGVLNFQANGLGQPLAYNYESVNGGFKFSGQPVFYYPSVNSQVTTVDNQYPFNFSEVQFATQNKYTSVVSTQDQSKPSSVFQLEQYNTNLPENEIYSGVFYKMKKDGKYVIPPVFDLPSGVGSYPFPSTTSKEVVRTNNGYLIEPLVMFIPFTTYMSYFSGGTCQPAQINTGMLMVNDWILEDFGKIKNNDYESHFSQKQCYGNLGRRSKWCAYIGQSCNNGHGYQYCKKNEVCGKCYGSCPNGMYCTVDSTKRGGNNFYCSTNNTGSTTNDPISGTIKDGVAVTRKGGYWALPTIIIMVVAMALLIVLFFVIGYYQDKGSITHMSKRFSSIEI